MTQPEARLSRRIIQKWREMGAWCFKVHGNEFQPSGIPDICGIYEGYSVWCETKMPGGKLSSIQQFRIRRIREAGGLVVVAQSWQDAVQLLIHIRDGYHEACIKCPCPWGVDGKL